MESNTRHRVWAQGWQEHPEFFRVWNSTIWTYPPLGITLRPDGTYWAVQFIVGPTNELAYFLWIPFLDYQDAIKSGGLIPDS